MGNRILFWPDVYLEQGHWLPTVVWANGLKGKGYDVAYMGIADCASVVSPFGYVKSPESATDAQGTFHEIFSDLYPLGYTRENHGSIAERWKTDHVFSIANGELDFIFANKDKPELKPDLLVSGYFTSLESLMLHYKYGVDVVLTTTFLRHPQEDPAIRALQNLTAFPREVAKKLMFQVAGTMANSMEIEDFVKPLEHFHELIPCPREFEFSHYQSGDKVHYVEPCMTPESSDKVNEFWASIPEFKYKDGKPTTERWNYIFATAGSQVQDYEERAENMFRQMINMMNEPQMRNYYLILAVGPKLARKDWGKASARYKIVSWAPQRAILEHPQTKAAMIHGGLATLKECIYYDKPFVLLPLGKDQLDNSLRVRECELGEIAYPDSIRSAQLLKSLNRALSDRRMNQQREKMSDIFESAETAGTPAGLQIIIDQLEKENQPV